MLSYFLNRLHWKNDTKFHLCIGNWILLYIFLNSIVQKVIFDIRLIQFFLLYVKLAWCWRIISSKSNMSTVLCMARDAGSKSNLWFVLLYSIELHQIEKIKKRPMITQCFLSVVEKNCGEKNTSFLNSAPSEKRI